MATPTPSTNTPQKNLNTLSSPAPRSVPPMNFDSPAVLNMLGEGGVGMGISMSGMGMSSLGLTASQLGRADEDERRRRLEGIIALINKRKGRVSEEGIAALCRQENVEIMREVQGDGTIVLTLVIGNEAMCDISLLNEEVTSVKLELATDDDDVYKTSGSRILKKSLVPPPGVRRINTTLDRFALNLDKLIKMDKLSAENGGVGCYKAIFSVHASLKKLFEHEKKLALELIGADTPNAVYKAEREVLCKKSGRPRMNAGYCLGLSLEYWMDRRHLVSRRPHDTPSTSAKGKEKEDAALQATLNAYPEDADPDTNKIYSLTIECEGAPSSMHTPIRIPDAGWIAEPVEKDPSAADTAMNNLLLTPSSPQINWLDPKPTYLDSEGDATATTADAAAIPPQTRLPNIRFVAKFNPPLAVPLSLYVSILQSLGQEYNPQDLRATTFVGLALRPDEPDPGMAHSAGGATAEVHSERHVVSVDAEGAEHQRLHRNALYVPKLEYARCLESLPFSHPRQLVELLPTLRQHAFATSLLQDVFAARASSPITPGSTPPSPTLTLPALNVDISLTHAPPNPRLTLHMPHPTSLGSSSATTTISPTPLPTSPTDLLSHLLASNNISAQPSSSASHPPLKLALDILPNGEVFVAEQNAYEGAISGATEGEQGDKVRRLGRGLEVAGEVGVWVEWVGREVGGGK